MKTGYVDWVFLNGVREIGHREPVRGLDHLEPNTRISSVKFLAALLYDSKSVHLFA